MYSGLMVPFLFMATGYRCHLPSIFANFVKVTVGALLIISSEFPTKNLQGSKSLGVHRHNDRHNEEKMQKRKPRQIDKSLVMAEREGFYTAVPKPPTRLAKSQQSRNFLKGETS